MSKSRDARSSPAIILPPPEIDGFLPDIPGGATNLLPEALTRGDLKVWFTVPEHSDPSAGKETVELFVDDNPDPVVTRDDWTQPIAETDRFVVLPQLWLRSNDGEHRLKYKVTIYNSTWDLSSDLVMTLDTQAPVLPSDSKLVFPPEVLPPNKLTAHYLEGNDALTVGIPSYTLPQPGDVITWYWDRNPSGTTVGGILELTADNYNKPLALVIEGEWIRSQGDGDRYVWYTTKDRAGNLTSGQSAVQRLDVAAQPIPRILPPPKVVEASGTGWPVRGTLSPTDALNGVNVILNPTSVIHPGEVPQVRWAKEGDLGSFLADPVSAGEWKYQIPKAFMAPHFGKAIAVNYLFKDKLGKLLESDEYTLTVLNYPVDRLQAPQSADGSPLSLAAVPASGASFTLYKWPFSAAKQRITIAVEGLEDASGKTIRHLALDNVEVTSGQADAGIAKGEALVPKADFLSRIRPGVQLTVKAYVSFDNGQTWNGAAAPNLLVAQFPWLKVTLTV